MVGEHGRFLERWTATAAPLWERVSWGDSTLNDPAQQAHHRQLAMAHALAFLFTIGATLAIIMVVFDGFVQHLGPIVAIALAAYLIAALTVALAERLPPWSFHLSLASGTAMITAVIGLGGPHAVPFSLLYFWVVVYAAYFFRPKPIVLHVVLVAAAYGALIPWGFALVHDRLAARHGRLLRVPAPTAALPEARTATRARPGKGRVPDDGLP